MRPVADQLRVERKRIARQHGEWEATQVRLKAQWSSRRYASTDQAMQSYYLKQVSVAQYFTPKLDEYEINYTAVQQLPMRARDALVTIDSGNTNAVARALAQLDASFEENENRDIRRNPGCRNSSYNTSPNISGSSVGSRYVSSSLQQLSPVPDLVEEMMTSIT